MTNLADVLFSSLRLHRQDRDREVSRRDMFADVGFDRDDLRAARARQRRRS